ncbi:MAG TPA: calcium-binding protein [Oligoflexus sp.]|uniref:calcium-binding protein n=1 Tax=Oligoflexus sp. TaxID=1971216 RepID=UPI002D25939E|nr:calcium-binding protein [Oligoflexus sp.]HYX34248.1 calcium-binding protein [Oligoflexus sp.]
MKTKSIRSYLTFLLLSQISVFSFSSAYSDDGSCGGRIPTIFCKAGVACYGDKYVKGDVILGSSGNDLIYARSADIVCGGDGDDLIYGSNTDDSGNVAIINGGRGSDKIYGSRYGGDIINGGEGDDWITGANSSVPFSSPLIQYRTVIDGGPGNDRISASRYGNTEIDGGEGIDSCSSGGFEAGPVALINCEAPTPVVTLPSIPDSSADQFAISYCLGERCYKAESPDANLNQKLIEFAEVVEKSSFDKTAYEANFYIQKDRSTEKVAELSLSECTAIPESCAAVNVKFDASSDGSNTGKFVIVISRLSQDSETAQNVYLKIIYANVDDLRIILNKY